jgi:AmmeMemoRadiSam system protein A
MLSQPQRKTLLRIARDSIRALLDGSHPDLGCYEFDDVLTRPSGAFVTLNTRAGELRGCIGSVRPVAPLYRVVSQSAIHAAFRDPRFHPISRDELDLIHLEISVMGPIEPVSDVADIEVGRDGLIVSRGSFAGLLLPQVAAEYGWSRDVFLSQTCVKAGLPPAAWQSPGTKIERFFAEVFGEQKAQP